MPDEGTAMVDKRTQQSPEPGNTEKDPRDWVTGDEPMTGAQRSYLKTLSEEAKQPFDASLTKAQASCRIEELQAITGRGVESAAGEEDPGAALGDAATRDAVSAEAATVRHGADRPAAPIEGDRSMTAHDRTIDTLNDLIETSKDGEYGFRACAEQAASPELKRLFEERAASCKSAASQLQAHVVDLGGAPQTGGSAVGTVHRGWVALRSILSTYDDLAVLEECERGEDAARESYEEALRQDLPPRIRNLVQQQFAGVQRNHAEIRRLRDSFRTART